MNVDTWTRAQRATVAVLGLLIVAIPFVVWGLGSMAQIASRHECALVDARRVLLSEGTDFVFTVPEAGRYQIEVSLSEHCTSTATVRVSPLRTALRPDPVYEPDEAEHTWKVKVGTRPEAFELKEAGPYVLRIEPIPMAMGNDGEPTAAHVVVRHTPR